MNDNCLYCMFSEYSDINIKMNDMFESDYTTCRHENSPYYNESVNEDKSCRFFLDTNKYFLRKDRKEKLEHLKNNPDLFL